MAAVPLSWPGDGVATAPPFHPDQPWAETASLQAGGWFGAPAPQLGQLLPEAYAGHPGPQKCNNYFPDKTLTIRFDTSAGTYGIGDPIDIHIGPTSTHSNDRIGGTSSHHWIRTTILVMETGAVDRNATYYSHTPPSNNLQSALTGLIYRYTVQQNDTSDRLDYIDSQNSLWWGNPSGGADLQTFTGQGYRCFLPNPGSSGSLSDGRTTIKVDGIRPFVRNVTAADGTHASGETVTVRVNFNEDVFVVQGSEPVLTLNFTGGPENATFSSGNGSRQLEFTRVLGTGDNAARLDYNGTGALQGGTIKDGAGNDWNMRLAAPGEPGSLGRTSNVKTDTDAPIVTSVESPTQSGTYGIGDSIQINVEFNEDVAVTGAPRILLDAGATNRYAAYDTTVSTAADVLAFTYEVAEGDMSADLDYNTAATIDLNSGTIRDAAGNNAVLGLPAPGSDGLLSSPGDTLVIDGVRPTVASVSSPDADDTYGIGSLINVTVRFDNDVTVDTTGGTPYLELATGDTIRRAEYVSGSPGQSLVFQYTVAENDASTDLDYNGASALSLNGGSITDGAGNPATQASLSLSGLTVGSTLAGSKALVVDGVRPTVASVSSPDADDTYGIGSLINVTVRFDNDVTVDTTGGTPYLELATGDTIRRAEYASGSPGQSLVFQYTVAENDASTDLDYNGASALSLNGGSITDGAGNPATQASLSLSGLTVGSTLAGSKALVVDGVRPTVDSVSSPDDDGTYGIGSLINVTVRFDNDVTVDTTGGTPYLELATGDTIRRAEYASGSPGQSLVFQYTVAENDASTDLDYNGASALSLNGGSITDGADNPATQASLSLSGLTVGSTLAGSKALVVDGVRPTVDSVSSPDDDGTYGIGSLINVTVRFDNDVTVDTTGGTPYLELATGDTIRRAEYVSGSPGQSLVFQYTVAENDASTDLDYNGASALSLNGGSITDGADNPATQASLSLSGLTVGSTLAGSKALVVDGVRPGVVSVTSPNTTQTYYPNQQVHVHVSFNETVTATGKPFVELNADGDGGPARAVYSSGSPGETLTFAYRVLPDNRIGTLDYDGAGALMLDGGSIKDLAGNPARLALPGLGTPGSQLAAKSIQIEGDIPSVVSVASPDDDGAYGAGARINVTVAFNEAVRVDGSATPRPHIALNAGGEARAVYSSGSPGETLLFVYVVQPRDAADRLAYEGDLVGASAITATVGTPPPTAWHVLPSSGDPASLSGSSAISIDTAAPAVERVWSPNQTGTYTAGGTIRIVVVFNETVTVDASGGAPTLTLETGDTDRAAAYESGSGTQNLAFEYTVAAGDDSGGPLDYAGTSALSLNGGSITDTASNAAALALPDTGSTGSLAGSGIAVDAAPPRVERVASTNATGTYGAGEKIGINVVFTEAVAWPPEAASPSLALNAGGNASGTALYQSGNGTATLSFSYEVRIGDRTDGLSYNGTGALSGAGIADPAGNPANLTLPEPGSAGSLSASSSISLRGLAGPVAASAGASFTGPSTVRIEYSRQLGAPANHTGPVYGAITLDGGAGERNPLPGGVSGLGTSVHTVEFGGGAVDRMQTGSIALNTGLEFAMGSARYEFTADRINITAGEDALAPRGMSPVVAIQPDGFVRAVNATAAGDSARPAVNVSGLPAGADGSVTLPGSHDRVALIASFAEVSLPRGATVWNVTAGGLISLYVSQAPPTREAVADAFGASNASGIRVLRVVEVGGNEDGTRIAFSQPVRILLAGQANGSAFYLAGADGAVVPIATMCEIDGAASVDDQAGTVHAQLGGAGECEIDSGTDKVIYTYHLTPFGTARGPEGGSVMPACGISVKPRVIEFVEDLRPGMQSRPVGQTVSGAGSMPLSEVSISADVWRVEGAAATTMPANATSVLPRAGGEWEPMNGEIGLPLSTAGQADLQFRLAVPLGTAPVAETSQIVTYTASCAEPAG